MINPGHLGKRDQQLSCADSAGKKKGCVAKCDKRCPNQCIVLCPICKTLCMCDFYPGVCPAVRDPRFTGGDGNNFYFHRKKDQDFCIVSDADMHINAHFIGKRNPTMSRDFTWIQAGPRHPLRRPTPLHGHQEDRQHNVSASMPVVGGAPSYVSSDIFSTDCAVARFGRSTGISMVTARAS
ncbi:hypothetical protein ABZP36_014965 [Zizania latifolia]